MLKLLINVVVVDFYLFLLYKVNDDQHHFNEQEDQQNGEELRTRKSDFICNDILWL